MLPRGLITVLFVSSIVAPTLAFANLAPPRPAAGKWKIDDGGGFTVNRSRNSISSFSVKPGGTAGCGTAEIRIAGEQKLSTVSRGGVTNWVVGRSSESGSALISGVGTVKVKVHQGGHDKTGGLSLLFAVAGNPLDNDGALTFGGCTKYFDFEK